MGRLFWTGLAGLVACLAFAVSASAADDESPRRWSYAYDNGRVTLLADRDRAAVLLHDEHGEAVEQLAAHLERLSGFQAITEEDAQTYPGLYLPRFAPGLSEPQQLAAVEALAAQPGVRFASLLMHYRRALLIARPEIIVVLRPGAPNDAIDELLLPGDLEVVHDFPALDPTYLLAFDGTPQETFARCDELLRLDAVAAANPNFIRRLEPHTTPNDPLFSSQWDMDNTGQFGGTPGADLSAIEAWDLSTGSTSITIAILDEGVDVDHVDLAANMVPGHDSVTADPTPGGVPGNARDSDPHGTATAGLAGAVGNNGEGISGVNWVAKIMPVRLGFGSWWTQDDWIIDAITWATDNGADVLSNSWGGGPPSTPEQNAIIYATTVGRSGLGAAVFFSSGNSDSSVDHPAAYPQTIAVGATSPCDERKSPSSCDGEWWWGSCFGSELDIVAPGPLVTSTDIMGSGGYTAGDYTDFSGTSSACPHAAGAGALLLSLQPGFTQAQVRSYLQNSADDEVGIPSEDTAGWDQYMGWGRVNLFSLLQLAGGGVAPPTSLNCSVSGPSAFLTWVNGEVYSSIVISRNGTDVATLSGFATSYTDPSPGVGTVDYGVRGILSGAPSSEVTCSLFFTGGATDLVFAPPASAGTVNGGQALVDALVANGRTPLLVDDLTAAGPLNVYETIRVNLGIYPDNHALTSGESALLAPYLTDGVGGSFAYMEGGDTWAFDTATAFHDLFEIDGLSDGTADLGTVLGESAGFGCDLSAMTFNYVGENNWIDQLAPLGSAATILANESPAYDVGIFRDAGLHRTIGASLEFGGLADGSWTKAELMEAFLSCFGSAGAPAPITDLTCVQSGSHVLLTWTNNDSYTAIEVHRDGVLLAMLNGDDETYIDDSPLNGTHVYEVTAYVGGFATDPDSCVIFLDLPDNVLRAGDHQGAPGETISALFRADLGLETSGYSFGAEFDPAVLQVDDLNLDGTVTGTLGADFFAPNVDNVLGYFTVGVVLDISPPITTVISAGNDQPLLNALLTIDAGASLGLVTIVTLPELTVGSPSVAAVFVQGGGSSYVPTLIDGTVTVVESFDMHLFGGTAEGPSGGSADHYTLATNEVPIAGFSYGLDFDETILSVASLDLAGTVPGGLGADFFAPQINNDPGGGWYAVGVVIDLAPPIVTFMPPGTQEPLVHAVFEVSPSATPGTITPLTLTADVGDPPVAVVFSQEGGTSYVPVTTDGFFEVTEGGIFIRADVDMNGMIQITDPVVLLDHLFSFGPILCADAGDANDDGALDVADAVYNLAYQFVSGPLPPAPFPSPGVDPTDDPLGCDNPL